MSIINLEVPLYKQSLTLQTKHNCMPLDAKLLVYACKESLYSDGNMEYQTR